MARADKLGSRTVRLGEYFASQGIAALIYDKRGTGQSGGAYESREPYENLVNDALAGCRLPEAAPRDRTITDWHLGAQSRRLHQRRRGIPIGRHSNSSLPWGHPSPTARCSTIVTTCSGSMGCRTHCVTWPRKHSFVQDTLPHNLQDESLLSSFAPRSYPPPDEYVHPAWSHVHQPVLVMWGQLDQHQPVGESIAGFEEFAGPGEQ